MYNVYAVKIRLSMNWVRDHTALKMKVPELTPKGSLIVNSILPAAKSRGGQWI